MKIDPAQLIVRKADVGDVPLLVAYRMRYLTELQGEMDERYKLKLLEDLTRYFDRALTEGRFIAFYAELEERVVSFGGMVIKEIPGDIYKTMYLEGDILNMYTVPEARRQGVSSVILEALLDEAKKRGISKVALHTSKDGEKLYRKYHFTEPVYPYLERSIDTEK
ncbi:GNAT family N-acetyltransferase [Prolixibacter sp. NT017]|uniref:GNAT family N-acetyltransferase n=1 Tax=Prolixibacter sp. NT017 TaxID=2652390 RepID=UPI00128A8A29|nr:GNAT family N-acetyltransferase [Prolixibacter sp. NT017]GET26077.1 N-acetyltransferase [Prolixibacter sp. NT017]